MNDSTRWAAEVNVAWRLKEMATRQPDAIAIAAPAGGKRGPDYDHTLTFSALDAQTDRIAAGLRAMGVKQGMRLALLVPPSIEFISLVFALLKAGAVTILIDPGMGRRNLVGCLADAVPEGFVATARVHAMRTLLRRRFPKARHNVTVGWPRWPGTRSLAELQNHQGRFDLPRTTADDPAAIIFTTGSTGPPKGVLYRHGNFDSQVDQLREFYGIAPGEIDLPGFPLFGLFNCAMGVTTVIPEMDATRPAKVDPRRVIAAVTGWEVTQAFGSPAMWNRVAPYCATHHVTLASLKRVLSAGAPVPPRVLQAMKDCIAPDGEVHTPYGATEALPVASISSAEVLGQTAEQTRRGAGVCVGRKFSGIRWKVIEIVDGPIAELADARPLPAGSIGELIVSGPVVTREYATRRETNRLAKIRDGETVWHRMGDAGYLDAQDRFWFCGRVAHRVTTPAGVMYSVCCEAIFNNHPDVFRSALVGIGPTGLQRPVIVVEPRPGRTPGTVGDRQRLLSELRQLGLANPLTECIEDFLLHRAMPVDIRHNSKIFREKLAVWATRRLHRVGQAWRT